MNFLDPKYLFLLKTKALQLANPKSLFKSPAQNLLRVNDDRIKIKADKQYGYMKGDKLPSKARRQPNKSDLLKRSITEEFNINA